MNLVKYVDMQLCTTSRIKVSSTVTGSKIYVDMAGFEGVAFVALFSSQAAGTTGVGKFKKTKTWLSVKASSISTGTYKKYFGLAVASSSGLAAGVNKRILVLDIPKINSNLTRYIKPFIYGSSSTGVTIMAIKYGARRPGSSACMKSTGVTGSTASINWSTAFQTGTSAT
jgi:hypothetical protein